MNILVATSQSQGAAPNDFCYTVEGELVWFPIPCDSPTCECKRAMSGLASHRATSTVRVVDRPDITFQELVDAIADSAETQGYQWLFDDVGQFARKQAEELTVVADGMGPAAVLERRDDYFLERLFCHELGWVALGAIHPPSHPESGT